MERGQEGVRRQPAQPGDQLAVGRPAQAHGQAAHVRQLQAVLRSGRREPGLGQRHADQRRSAGRSLLGDQGECRRPGRGHVSVVCQIFILFIKRYNVCGARLGSRRSNADKPDGRRAYESELVFGFETVRVGFSDCQRK